MNRRSVLGLGGAVLAGFAGCPGSAERGTPVVDVDSSPTAASTPTRAPAPGPKQGDDLPPDDTPDDGYPPQFSEVPEARGVDASSFESVERDGVDVPLAPIDVAYYWYARREAWFADVTAECSIEVETPGYRVTGSLRELTDGAVDGRNRALRHSRSPLTTFAAVSTGSHTGPKGGA